MDRYAPFSFGVPWTEQNRTAHGALCKFTSFHPFDRVLVHKHHGIDRIHRLPPFAISLS